MKPPPSEVVITKDNVAQYFKVTDTQTPHYWKNSVYGNGGEFKKIFESEWTALYPQKYSISFDFFAYTEVGYVKLDDTPYDPMGYDTLHIENKTVSRLLFRSENRAPLSELPDSKYLYYSIFNIRLKPIQ